MQDVNSGRPSRSLSTENMVTWNYYSCSQHKLYSRGSECTWTGEKLSFSEHLRLVPEEANFNLVPISCSCLIIAAF